MSQLTDRLDKLVADAAVSQATQTRLVAAVQSLVEGQSANHILLQQLQTLIADLRANATDPATIAKLDEIDSTFDQIAAGNDAAVTKAEAAIAGLRQDVVDNQTGA